MRTIHRLRELRRARNLSPLSVLGWVRKAGQIAKAADDLRHVPRRLNQIGEAAQSITDSRLADRLGQTAQQVSETTRWVKYAAIGGLGIAGLIVLRRPRSRD